MINILKLLVILYSSTVFSSPLKPVKMDTPRDTMKSFMHAMDDYVEGVDKSDPALELRIQDAIKTLNLDSVPYLLRQEKGKKTAQLLKEVLDRVIVVDLSLVPDTKDIQKWRLKDTEIIISALEDGENQGEFRFSAATVERVEEFYKIVKNLPYLEGTSRGSRYQEPLKDRLIPTWAKSNFLGLKKWQWAGLLISILLGTILRSIVTLTIDKIKGVSVLTGQDENTKRRRILEALEKPVGLMCAGLFWFASIYLLAFEGKSLSVLVVIIQVVLSISIVWALYRLTDVITEYLSTLADATESELDDLLVPMISKSLRIFVVVVGVLVTIQNLGINVMSLVAGLGLGGLAFALAAKDTAANLFGSIMILVDRPFKPGDWITVGGVEGSVESIGFRSTRVRTFYNSLVSIPNAALANDTIDNMGARAKRRIRTFFGLTYNTPPQKIEEFMDRLKQIIEECPETVKDSYTVSFYAYQASSLDILFNVHIDVIDTAEEHRVRQEIYLKVLKAAETIGVSFAYPSQSLYIESVPKGIEKN